MIEELINETKTWQEIKLRKPNQEICESMQVIISDFSEISASKALEKLILNYPRQKSRIKDLEETERIQKQQIRQLEMELANQKKLIADIRKSYKNLTALLSDD